jgi:hypothetical protein
MRRTLFVLSALAVATSTAFADDGLRLITMDHHVRVKSTAPGFHGQDAQIYVREVVLAGTVVRLPIAWCSSSTARARLRKSRSTFLTRTTAAIE